jgi:hypothetical protein
VNCNWRTQAGGSVKVSGELVFQLRKQHECYERWAFMLSEQLSPLLVDDIIVVN